MCIAIHQILRIHNIMIGEIQMNHPRVSIIIPLKDTLPYFKKCYDSLLAQTCSNIEIIIVDDASSQDISGFLSGYDRTPKTVYLRNETALGPGACRNIGIDVAQGQYISFCDSDDWVDLNYYEHICNHLDKTTADLAMVSMKREFPFGNRNEEIYLCRYSQHYTLNPEIAIRSMCGDYEDLGIKVASACMNKVYRREFLQRSNTRFEEGVYFQGTMFSIFTFLRATKIDCIPDITYHHFRRKGSIIQSFNVKHIQDFGNCCQMLRKYFTDMNQFEIYKDSFYRKCIFLFDLVIQEIFEYVPDETQKKKYIMQMLEQCFNVISAEEWLSFLDSETIRRHLQPDIRDTTLY